MLRLSLWLARLVFGFIILWLVILGIVLLRLTEGSLDLRAYEHRIEKVLSSVFSPMDIQIKNPRLTWQGSHHPIEIELDDVNIYLNDQSFQVDQAKAFIRLRSLIIGDVLPSGLVLKKPALHVKFDPHSPGQSAEALFESLKKLWLLEKSSKTLKSFSLEGATLIVDTMGQKDPFVLKNINLQLERTKKGIELVTGGQGLQDLSWQGRWNYDRKTQAWSGQTSLNQMPFAAILNLEPLQKFTHIHPDSGMLLNLQIKGTLTDQWVGQLEASLSQGTIGVHTSPQETLQIPLQHATATALWSGDTILFDTGLATDQGLLKGQAVVTLPKTKENGADYKISGILKLSEFSMDNLVTYWPKSLSTSTREWIITHISKATVPRATFAAKATVTSTGDVRIQNLGGDIQLENAKVSYISGMPPVEGMAVRATYSPRSFDIKIKGGRVFQHTLTTGQIYLKGMDQESQTADITFGIQGGLEKTLELINHPGLRLLDHLGLPAKVHKGQQNSKVRLDFPLSTSLTSSQIKINVESILKNVDLDCPAGQKIWSIHQGQGTLMTTNQGIDFKGTGLFYGEPAKIQWNKDFQASSLTPMTLRLESVLSPALLTAHAPEILPYFKGRAAFKATLLEKPLDILKLDLEGALMGSTIILGSWEKLQGKSSVFKLQALYNKGALQSIEHFKILGDGLNLAMDAHFDPKGALDQFKIHQGIFGQSRLTAELLKPLKGQKIPELRIQGDCLDLEPFWDLLFSQDATAGALDLDTRLNLARLFLKKGDILYDPFLSLQTRKGKVQTLSLLTYGQPGQLGRIRLNIRPKTYELQTMDLDIDNAGLVLKNMGIIQTIDKGRLKMTATKLFRSTEAPWLGHLWIDGFKLRQAPFLGRLLTLAFPTGFKDFIKGDSLSFDQLKLKFQANSYKISITEGRAHGPSLGFTLFGTFDRVSETLDLSGSIIPAYFLNTLFSKIPFLGQALTGGKNEGLFGVVYRVKGPLKKLDISANPISALTPGFLRRLFMGQDPENLEKDASQQDRESRTRR